MKSALSFLAALSLSIMAHAVTPKTQLDILINESNVVFDSHVKQFSLQVDGTSLTCRDRAFWMDSEKSLYEGWNSADADKYREIPRVSKFREYTFASCRNEKTEALAWFTKPRELDFIVSEQLLSERYDSVALPLYIQVRSLEGGAPSYYACSGKFTKTLVKERPEFNTFQLTSECEPVSPVSAAERGPIDFVLDPGPFAALASYRGWMLPSVTSTQESFDKATKTLLQYVEEGTYTGVMKTLQKACKVEISVKGDTLYVNHTILGTKPRTRRLELKASQLIGTAENVVFADPIRVEEKSIGRFAAAEFQTDVQDSVTIRFERLNTLDGQIVRINGSDTYCRRLQKQ